MGKEGVLGLVKTTQNASPITIKPVVQITKQQSPQTNDPFTGWANAYNNARKDKKKGNIASNGALIVNQQQPSINNHNKQIPQSQQKPTFQQYQSYNQQNITPINYPMMMQQPQPNYFPMQMGYPQAYVPPYNYNPYPPIMNNAPSNQMGYMPSYIPSIQSYQPQSLLPQQPSFLSSNKPININITNTVQQPINNNSNTTVKENKEDGVIQQEYKPYSLEEYKELNRVEVVMGNLGPNIGTKEWEQKKKKMKRIADYSHKLNKEQKGIKHIKTETPFDENARERKNKIENSHRYKSYEYGKLVRPKGVTSDQFYYKDINVQTKNEKSDQILKELNTLNENNDNNNNIDVITSPVSVKEGNPQQQQQRKGKTIEQENEELNYLLKQRENYKSKINAIKDSLL